MRSWRKCLFETQRFSYHHHQSVKVENILKSINTQTYIKLIPIWISSTKCQFQKFDFLKYEGGRKFYLKKNKTSESRTHLKITDKFRLNRSRERNAIGECLCFWSLFVSLFRMTKSLFLKITRLWCSERVR